MSNKTETVRLSYEAFTNQAILKLRDVSKSKGINTVFSGFNDAMKAYYGAEALDAITETYKVGEETRTVKGASAIVQKLYKEGKIEMRPTAKGVQIFIKGDMASSRANSNGTSVLAKLGLKPVSG